MSGNDGGGSESFLMYEGGDPDVFKRVVDHKFGGDKANLSSRLASILYPPMMIAMRELHESIVDGETAATSVTVYADILANIISNTVANVYPEGIHEAVIGLIVKQLSTDVPMYTSSICESRAKIREEMKYERKN